MSEKPPQTDPNAEKERKDREIAEFGALILEMNKNQERFPFPGIDPEAYAKIKDDEETIPDYTTYATPIDTLVARCRAEGIKVVLGKNPASGNIFILPAGSDDIEMDSLLPRHLPLDGIMDGRLRQLVKISKTRKW